MSTAENAKWQYESGQSSVAQTALTDSADHLTFTSGATLWSGKSGYAPVVRPNGLLTGGVITPNATNDKIDVAALTANLQGVVTSVGASVATLTLTRPATNVSKVNSITVNAGGALAVVAGTDGATTAFSETRAAAGGPPLIPVDSVEIGQVQFVTSAAGAITAAMIYQVVGTHVEAANFPLFDINYKGGSVTFLSALPLIHTGTVAKKVYSSYASPLFADISLASDFKAPETSHSVTSTQVYGTSIGASSETLGQGGFVAYLEDGVTDALVGQKNQMLWFKFFPDRYKSPYMLSQGKLGIARVFPAGDQIKATCTISATQAATEVAA
jgi:hypothetical protein